MIPETILVFLMENGFVLIDQDLSTNFGNYYKVFDNGILLLRFSVDRSKGSIDICSKYDKENWFDLALIKALLYKEQKLNSITTFEVYCDFLMSNLSEIIECFEAKNYLTTKSVLQELSREKVRQMFPGKLH